MPLSPLRPSALSAVGDATRGCHEGCDSFSVNGVCCRVFSRSKRSRAASLEPAGGDGGSHSPDRRAGGARAAGVASVAAAAAAAAAPAIARVCGSGSVDAPAPESVSCGRVAGAGSNAGVGALPRMVSESTNFFWSTASASRPATVTPQCRNAATIMSGRVHCGHASENSAVNVDLSKSFPVCASHHFATVALNVLCHALKIWSSGWWTPVVCGGEMYIIH
eukprot:7377721-Prymnesium_polylepis.2